MSVYLKSRGGSSFGCNDLTSGLMRLPDFHWLRGTLKEIRRTKRPLGHKLTRATVEAAYTLALDELNPEND